MNTDTPLPPDEPAGQNPPDGAMIDYLLAANASGPVTLEIKNAKGELIRRYSSDDKPPEIDRTKLKIPNYWIRSSQSLSAKAGMHRFLWDMHFTPIPDADSEFPMSAEYHDTPPRPTSPWVMPGEYTLILTVDGKSVTQPLTVKMDPRVKTSLADLEEQFELSQRLYQLRQTLAPVAKSFDEVSEQLMKLRTKAAERRDVADKLEAFVQRLKEFGPPRARPGAPPSFFLVESAAELFDQVQAADAAPTAAVKEAATDLQNKSGPLAASWQRVLERDLPALNQELKPSGFPEIKATP
jgi:hypothetical protein